MIGNGFDINIGLKTRYTEFYQHYVGKYPDDMLAQAIGKNHIYWSDLELGLGRYTEQIKPEEEEVFWNSEANLEQELANYLESQLDLVKINDADKRTEIALEMQRSLIEFSKELPENFKEQINNILGAIRENITYSFISFNYTTVLDQCLDIAKKIFQNSIGKRSFNGGLIYSDNIGDVIHIHGTTETEMVLGVNDEEQISNKNFSKNNFYRQLLIKEETIKRYNTVKNENAYRYIDDSIIICVFGMSIGRTDKRWWQYICKWLQEDDTRLLIIYEKINQEKWISKYTLFAHQDEMMNRLKNNADLTDDAWEQIKKQIHVKCNPNIFNFNILGK